MGVGQTPVKYQYIGLPVAGHLKALGAVLRHAYVNIVACSHHVVKQHQVVHVVFHVEHAHFAFRCTIGFFKRCRSCNLGVAHGGLHSGALLPVIVGRDFGQHPAQPGRLDQRCFNAFSIRDIQTQFNIGQLTALGIAFYIKKGVHVHQRAVGPDDPVVELQSVGCAAQLVACVDQPIKVVRVDQVRGHFQRDR